MKPMPTMEGGLRLEMDTPVDWLMLEHIAIDAMGKDGGKLAERLGALMDEESDWEEVVIPELRVLFSEQLGVVARAVKVGRDGLVAKLDEETGEEEAEDGPVGEVFIKREEAEAWYGALNQARLGLESRYRFGTWEEMEMEEIGAFSEEKLGAYFRMRFYSNLQCLLLDYAME